MKKFVLFCAMALSLSALATTVGTGSAAPSSGSATGLSAPSNPSTGSGAAIDSNAPQSDMNNTMDQQRMEDSSNMDSGNTQEKTVAPADSMGTDSDND